MTFWSGEKLLGNSSVVLPFDPQAIDYNSYTLRMGSSYYTTADGESKKEQKRTSLKDGESFTIPPGQFAFLLTKEEVDIPHASMAFISMKLTQKFQGLINVSGFNVDPGYKGKLVFGVFNAGANPVHLSEGEPLFKIWFCDLDRTSGSNYIYGGAGITDISNDLINRMSKEILSLQTMADRVRKLESDVEKKFAEQKPTIDNLVFIWRTIILAVVGAAVLAFLSVLAPKIRSLNDVPAAVSISPSAKSTN